MASAMSAKGKSRLDDVLVFTWRRLIIQPPQYIYIYIALYAK